jgi:hypothetical protein
MIAALFEFLSRRIDGPLMAAARAHARARPHRGLLGLGRLVLRSRSGQAATSPRRWSRCGSSRTSTRSC